MTGNESAQNNDAGKSPTAEGGSGDKAEPTPSSVSSGYGSATETPASSEKGILAVIFRVLDSVAERWLFLIFLWFVLWSVHARLENWQLFLLLVVWVVVSLIWFALNLPSGKKRLGK